MLIKHVLSPRSACQAMAFSVLIKESNLLLLQLLRFLCKGFAMSCTFLSPDWPTEVVTSTEVLLKVKQPQTEQENISFT